jgi:hypothetical protein
MIKQYFRLAGAGVFALLLSASLWAQEGISAEAQQQIATIMSIKASFNAAQKKMDSNLALGLLAAAKDARVASIEGAIAPLQTTSTAVESFAKSGRVVERVNVEISGNVSEDLIASINGAGGTILHVSTRFGAITASLPVANIEGIAGRSDVKQVRTGGHKHTNVGSLTTQGYISHSANTVVAGGINGTGVTVGVLSDSALPTRVAALIASGDLPADTLVLPGQQGPANGTDEGTAMMEIVHDLAPGAKLMFATAFTSESSFADNIIALAAAGAKVIVDDVSWSDEGVFQDSNIAQAVNQVTAAGVIYFSSAANSGSKTFNTSTTWEGDFLDGGAVSGPVATIGETGEVHNFGTVATPQNFNQMLTSSDGVTLRWSDPLGGSSNDYDLFVLNSTGTQVLGFSANVQSGSQDPDEEAFRSPVFPANSRIVVVLFAGEPRALHVDSFGEAPLSISTTGATTGHNAGLNTVSMAATYWNSARTGTRPFTGTANPNENFSSDGLRKIFYYPDGSAITPGNFLFGTNGGQTLQKPDLAAADGVTTKTPGFNPFFGTSAAAPHAAAIAALVRSARPTYTVAQTKQAMTATALNSMGAGVDRDSGYGIAMANRAVQYALTH